MVIGEVAGAFGVRGEIKVSSFTDFPDRFKDLKAVYLGAGRREVRRDLVFESIRAAFCCN